MPVQIVFSPFFKKATTESIIQPSLLDRCVLELDFLENVSTSYDRKKREIRFVYRCALVICVVLFIDLSLLIGVRF